MEIKMHALSLDCVPPLYGCRRSKIMWEFHSMKITLIIIIPSNSENYSNNSGTYSKSFKMGEKSEMKVNHIIYLKL